ncbi:extracellular solute-binding protein [Clostridium sp. Marseille-P2415]|uniref:extracellular solute-binding protein n=1 Tax=Clostridium sp. Marseille-P2415 TaxID=1805471 RepID=UPI000988445B|nr:extracellular solute-binding protein [Clostridium sp. Marseille-P2415]
MKKKVMTAMFGLAAAAALAGCNASAKSEAVSGTKEMVEDKDLDYQYGEGTTFHSDEPVAYSMMFSDHENYPYKADWRLWSAIKDKTNVTFDLTNVARTDYNDKVSALVNTGSAPYIIPKIYDAAPFVDSGQVVAVSDWVQYMPNYQKCVKDWGMEEELINTLSSDGKYYRLPGMWEKAAGGYSLLIRKDVFEAAGVDVEGGEKNWTWEDFYEACKKVKEYTGGDYVWSDQYQLGCAMNLSGIEYGIRAGYSKDGGDWNLRNGLVFDFDKNEFVFSNTTEDYKDYLNFWNKMYRDKILDPETFTQDSEQAKAKFFRGDSYVLTCNFQQVADYRSKNRVQAKGAELYFMVMPGGPKGQLQPESYRLENGIMISKRALKELGEKEFIKMLRFIDWLWYSDEGQTLSLWGVEGETYDRGADGTFALKPDIYYNGIHAGAPKQLNVDFGFAGGVFAYGGSNELRFSRMTDEEKEWNQRVYDSKERRKIEPPILTDEEEKEQMNLIQVPLMDYVNTSALEFITGKLDLDSDWDKYVAECESKGNVKFVNMANEIFERSKALLGY